MATKTLIKLEIELEDLEKKRKSLNVKMKIK